MVAIQKKTYTMTELELDTLIKSISTSYEKIVSAKIEDRVNRVISSKTDTIFCRACKLNILFREYPSIFGSREGSELGVYHQECWNKLRKEA